MLKIKVTIIVPKIVMLINYYLANLMKLHRKIKHEKMCHAQDLGSYT